MGQQPPAKMIDKEIRSLVALLNEASYIQTSSSCSGHPQMPEKDWGDGWITVEAIGDPEKLWNFLDALRARLENSTAMKIVQYYDIACGGLPQLMYIDKIRDRYREMDSRELLFSGVPILTINYSFTLCPFCASPDNILLIWEKILVTVQQFVSGSSNESVSILTAEAAANALIKQLHDIPYVQGTALMQDQYGRWRVEFQAMGDRCSCLWCWDLVNHVYGVLSQGEELQPQEDGRMQFLAEGSSVIRPVVKSGFVERTREEHMRIWKLIEATAQELIHIP